MTTSFASVRTNLYDTPSVVVTPAKMDYADIRAIRGRSANDIYMTGSNGAVYHYNGTTWKAVQDRGDGPRVR